MRLIISLAIISLASFGQAAPAPVHEVPSHLKEMAGPSEAVIVTFDEKQSAAGFAASDQPHAAFQVS